MSAPLLFGRLDSAQTSGRLPLRGKEGMWVEGVWIDHEKLVGAPGNAHPVDSCVCGWLRVRYRLDGNSIMEIPG